MQSSFAMSIGITSTYMENTTVQQDTTAVCQDHLHIRGEYDTDTDKERVYLGSPPHTWRIPITFLLLIKSLRITSTYVENTIEPTQCMFQIWDHLHIRGEYGIIKNPHTGTMGSPPHTWRILITIRSNKTADRITSTYVENTLFPLACR